MKGKTFFKAEKKPHFSARFNFKSQTSNAMHSRTLKIIIKLVSKSQIRSSHS